MTAGNPAYSFPKDAARSGVFSFTHFLAIFCCTTILLGACSSAPQTDRIRLQKLALEHCALPHTPAAEIQGAGFTSNLVDTQQSVMAIVSHLAPGSGLFVEEPLADGDPATSDALWIEDNNLADLLKIGDQVRLAGTVTEIGEQPHSLTALNMITGYVVCAENQPLPLHETGLPLDAGQREALEGMRVQIQQNLVVTNVRDALTRDRVSLSLRARLYSPTEATRPGKDAGEMVRQNQLNQIALQWTDYADSSLLDATPDKMQVNDAVFQFSGVLSESRYEYMVITESLGWLPAVRNTPAPPQRQSNLRVGSLNVLNYFNGDGSGGGFGGRRGAKTPQEFELQRGRLLSAIHALDADVLGIMEMENDGFGPESAIQDLVAALNRQNPDAGWTVAVPRAQRLGTGPVSVGILYKGVVVKAMGPASTLDTGAFARRSRPPLAQRFVHGETGQTFMVVVNHFKSKGSCPDDGPEQNQGDGQACWNPTRVVSADQLDQWLNSLRNILDEPRVVVLGDFNAMRMEDPIQLMRDRGWIDEAARFGHQPQHTFNFRGEAGTLDYIFSSDAMSIDTADARVWPINADFPIGGIENGPAYIRSSDHDPLFADFNLSQK
jgi:predicted extracellular nuclease